MTTSSPAPSPALRPLTAIRGLAALWVYLFHRSNLSSGSLFFSQFAKDGYFGLDIFFILSGFIISYVHFDEFATVADVRKNAARFLQLRLSRVYPLYLLLLLAFVNFQPTSGAGVKDFLQHLLLLQSWGWSNNQVWNVPDWSISVEWLIYLAFPFFAHGIFAQARSIAFNLVVLAGAMALWAFYLSALGVKIHDMVTPTTCLPRGILNFIIGVALHNLYREKFLEKLPWDAISVAAVAAILGTSGLRAHEVGLPEASMSALFALLIYALANIRGWANYVFANRAVVYLGTISYSIYMLQWIYLLLLAKHHGVIFDGQPFFTVQFAVDTAGLLICAAASYQFLEDPARQWLRELIEEEEA